MPKSGRPASFLGGRVHTRHEGRQVRVDHVAEVELHAVRVARRVTPPRKERRLLRCIGLRITKHIDITQHARIRARITRSTHGNHRYDHLVQCSVRFPAPATKHTSRRCKTPQLLLPARAAQVRHRLSVYIVPAVVERPRSLRPAHQRSKSSNIRTVAWCDACQQHALAHYSYTLSLPCYAHGVHTTIQARAKPARPKVLVHCAIWRELFLVVELPVVKQRKGVRRVVPHTEAGVVAVRHRRPETHICCAILSYFLMLVIDTVYVLQSTTMG